MDVITELVTTSVALAVMNVAEQKNKIVLVSGAASLPITNERCNANTVHWVYDSYGLASATAKAVVQSGKKNWYFIAADYAAGAELLAELPSVQRVVQVAGPLNNIRPVAWRDCEQWQACVGKEAVAHYERLPFSHPLWIVYSSGTTGLPKAMVHSQGGILLTHLKEMALQNDLRPGDRLLYLGSTGWAVWNLLVGATVTGASIVLYDGHPAWPTGDQRGR